MLLRTTSAGVCHDVDRVDHALLVLLLESLEHLVSNTLGDVRPDGDDFVVAFAVGDRAIEVLLLHFDHFVLGGVDELRLDAGDDHVADADGDAGFRCVEEAEFFQLVEHEHGLLEAEAQVAILHESLDAFLLEQTIDERHIRREVIVEDHAADGGVQELLVEMNWLGVRDVLVVVRVGKIDHFTCVAHANRREQFDFARFERHDALFGGTEGAAFALCLRLGFRHVVDAEDHVLRRNGERIAIGRRKNVVRAEH